MEIQSILLLEYPGQGGCVNVSPLKADDNIVRDINSLLFGRRGFHFEIPSNIPSH